jgi:hypothetical protein
VIVLIFALGSLALPDVRAAVIEFLRFGAVTIYLDGRSTEGNLLDLSQVSGETSLEEAQKQANFTLLVLPDDLPDRVFVQDSDLVILVWISGDEIEKALYQTANNSWRLTKVPGTIIETEVGDQSAYWASSQVSIQFSKDGQVYDEWTHFVDSNVLGWEQNGITLRLETNLSMDEARALAEAVRPIR